MLAFGARPLSRAIQKYIEDVLAEEIVNRKIPEGALLQFDWDGKSENLTFSISHEKNLQILNLFLFSFLLFFTNHSISTLKFDIFALS